MRDDYLQNALKVIDDPNILVNVISRRVKQLKRGNRPLIESLEKLSAEDTLVERYSRRPCQTRAARGRRRQDYLRTGHA